MQSLNTAIPAVPRKGLGSADCDSIYTIYISLCTQTADPIPFRGTHCTIPAASMIHTESKPVLWYLINILYVYIFFLYSYTVPFSILYRSADLSLPSWVTSIFYKWYPSLFRGKRFNLNMRNVGLFIFRRGLQLILMF